MKKKKVAFPETLHDAIKYFADEDRALDFMKSIRWPDSVVKCPRCGSRNVSFLATRRIWKCKSAHEKQQFSVKVGTVLEDSPIGLDKWLSAFWLIANAKNGISSYELHRSIGVTQKTAWFMLHRIRLAMQHGSIEKFSGKVEADETFIGGRARNMHADKRAETKSLQRTRLYRQSGGHGITRTQLTRKSIAHQTACCQKHSPRWVAQAHQKRSDGRLRKFHGCAPFVHRIRAGIPSQRNR